jgi:hypothetical protein
MTHRILVLYGSYRSDRMGIRLARFIVDGLRTRGCDVELVDAKAIGLPMLDRMYKEHPKGEAPAVLEELAGKIRGADGFVFVTGEYNWGMQPGLKNLTDHFLEEWFWRPAGPEEPHRPFSRRVVLAPCRYRELFGRSFLWCPRRDGVARHALRDGHGGDLVLGRGRADRANARRRRQADRRGRQGAGAGVPAFCG